MAEKEGLVKKIPASKALQDKVGIGKIDEKAVEEAQKIINESTVDFVPIARPHLAALHTSVAAALKKKEYGITEDMKSAIMNLKANAATFNYPLVSQIAETVLLFLEAQKGADKKIIRIVDLFYKTILLMLARKMSGKDHAEGRALQAAFTDVCRNYGKKKGVA